MKKIQGRRLRKRLGLVFTVPNLISNYSPVKPPPMQFMKPSGGIRIRNATIISMKNGAAPMLADVTVRGNRIKNIASPGEDRSAVETTIDGTGKFLIPALIDSHAHITPMRIVNSVIMDPLYMAAGVTSVRDMATGKWSWKNRNYGRRFDDTDFQGPRIFRVAGFFDGPPGVFSWAIIPKNKKEVYNHIDKIAAHKIKAIKIYSYMKPHMLKTITTAAHKKDLHVAGHIPLSMSAVEAADFGMNEFEHDYGIPDTILQERDVSFFKNIRKYAHNWERLNGREDELIHLARALKKRNIINVPTISLLQKAGFSNLPDLRRDRRVRYLPEYISEFFWGVDNPMLQRWSDEDFEAYRNFSHMQGRYNQILKDEGITILAGTDAPASFSIPGFSLHDELKSLVKYAGFSCEEALASATCKPAAVMRAADQIGTIEPGKMADMLLLDENPLKNIGAVEKIRVLIFNGQVATKEIIDHQLDALENKFHNFLHTKIISKSVKIGNNKGFSYLIPDPPGGWDNQ